MAIRLITGRLQQWSNVCKNKFTKEDSMRYTSSSRWFVLYGLDRVGWLALILGLCRCVDDLESK